MFGIAHHHKFTFHDVVCNILKKPSNFFYFKENVTGLPDPDREQSTEMKPAVAAANDAVRPA